MMVQQLIQGSEFWKHRNGKRAPGHFISNRIFGIVMESMAVNREIVGKRDVIEALKDKNEGCKGVRLSSIRILGTVVKPNTLNRVVEFEVLQEEAYFIRRHYVLLAPD